MVVLHFPTVEELGELPDHLVWVVEQQDACPALPHVSPQHGPHHSGLTGQEKPRGAVQGRDKTFISSPVTRELCPLPTDDGEVRPKPAVDVSLVVEALTVVTPVTKEISKR